MWWMIIELSFPFCFCMKRKKPSESFSVSCLSGLFVVLCLYVCMFWVYALCRSWNAQSSGWHVVNASLNGMPAAHHITLLSGVHEGGMREIIVTEDGYEHTPSSTRWQPCCHSVHLTGTFCKVFSWKTYKQIPGNIRYVSMCQRWSFCKWQITSFLFEHTMTRKSLNT